ncbi:DNA-binding response regulator [Xylanibacillus composti]|uniref:DNA-binding response regulator n=2 Tax=Paenibacillaceae TaxID=186822 RepID=A0A8J4M1Q6_9BACL|nr:DNA-binding response regulator [Xylanibacillus composti]
MLIIGMGVDLLKIKVIVADDNSLIREGMKIILSTFEEFEVLATVMDGQEAVKYCEQYTVDVALLDVRMPNMNGLEATKLIRERTSAKCLILTTFDDDTFIEDALKYGASGYLLKNNDPEKIRDAIRTVYNGHHVLQDTVLDKMRSGFSLSPRYEDGAKNAGYSFDTSPFTERELKIMALIAKGLTNREIAEKLFISEGTVANHVTSILGKTGFAHRTQIAIYYLTGEGK